MPRKKKTTAGAGTRGSRARRLTATEAARNFSEMVNRVRYNAEVFVVEKSGRAVCEVRPVPEQSEFTVADLVDLLRSLPSPGEDYLREVEQGIREQPRAELTRWRR